MFNPSNCVNVGRIAGVFGVKGWVKIQSATEPEDNIFSYHPWWVKLKNNWVQIEIDQYQIHKKMWIAQIKGVDSRTQAEAYALLDIKVEKTQFKALSDEEYYWHQLIGCRVLAQQALTTARDLGVVVDIMETGANDVLVIKPDDKSIDQRERLIPYVKKSIVRSVNLQEKKLLVDWHIED